MRYLRVRNLERYQHYKERNPPWVKLHQELLENYDFATLPDASKAHAMCLLVLASRMDNRLPADPLWIGRKISANTKVNLDLLVKARFLETCQDASGALADRQQDALPEGEGEGETETEKTLAQNAAFDEFWTAYPRKIGKGAAKRAWERASEKPPLPKLLAKLEALKRTRQWQDPQYIPHPSTWLNRGGWDDEPDNGSGSRRGDRPGKQLPTAERSKRYDDQTIIFRPEDE